MHQKCQLMMWSRRDKFPCISCTRADAVDDHLNKLITSGPDSICVCEASGINKYVIKILQYHCTATQKKQANLRLSEDWGSSLLAA